MAAELAAWAMGGRSPPEFQIREEIFEQGELDLGRDGVVVGPGEMGEDPLPFHTGQGQDRADLVALADGVQSQPCHSGVHLHVGGDPPTRGFPMPGQALRGLQVAHGGHQGVLVVFGQVVRVEGFQHMDGGSDAARAQVGALVEPRDAHAVGTGFQDAVGGLHGSVAVAVGLDQHQDQDVGTHLGTDPAHVASQRPEIDLHPGSGSAHSRVSRSAGGTSFAW